MATMSCAEGHKIKASKFASHALTIKALTVGHYTTETNCHPLTQQQFEKAQRQTQLSYDSRPILQAPTVLQEPLSLHLT